MTTVSLKDWLLAVQEATAEMAVQTLGLESNASGCAINENAKEMLPESLGSFISLISENDAVQVGLVAEKNALGILARAMLGMSPEESVADADMADAVGEIVNIIAGGVKKRLNDWAKDIKLGLPLFIEGKIAQVESQESAIVNVQLGDAVVNLSVLRKKG